MNYQFTGAGNSARASETWKIDEPLSAIAKHLVKRYGGERVLGLDVIEDRASILNGFVCPGKSHDPVSDLRWAATLRLANKSSTLWAGTRRPASAASRPT